MSSGASVIDFDAIRRVPIAAILARLGVLAKLHQKGHRLIGSCPIHRGNNPKAFCVDETRNLWHCFGDCDRGGANIELVAALQGVSARDAALLIGEWFAIGTSVRNVTSQRKEQVMSNEHVPAFKVFAVEDRDADDQKDASWWTRIGTGFRHRDGKGVNVILNALPINNRLVLREFDPEDAKKEEEQRSKRRR